MSGARSERRGFRLLRSEPADGAFNLALDEVLLEAGEPVLRLYAWEPPALSLGYFQPAAVAEPLAERLGFELVRRSTGGGTIAHVAELTFCVVDRVGAGVFSGSVAADTDRLHRTLATALTPGVPGPAVTLRGASPLRSDQPESGWLCFHKSSAQDLTVDGRKLVGSAARRSGGRVLQHGSIPLERNPATPGAAALRDLWGERTSFEALAQVLAEAFAREYHLELSSRPLEDAERGLAQERAAAKYRLARWTRKR